MTVTLIGYPVSPFVRKVRVALERKGIAYDLDPIVPYTDRKRVLEHNPSGTVPILLPGEGQPPITESADIVQWAEDQVPLASIIPTDPQMKQRALGIQQFADTTMAQVFGGMMFGQRIVVPFYFGKAQGKEDMVKHAMDNLAPQLLDEVAQLLGGNDYAAGSFSVADIAMASWLRASQLVGFEIDASKWPTITQWLERCYNQAGFSSVIEAEEELEVVKWARKRYA